MLLPVERRMAAISKPTKSEREALLTGSSRLAGLLRLSRAERHRILNGGIECQLVTAEL